MVRVSSLSCVQKSLVFTGFERVPVPSIKCTCLFTFSVDLKNETKRYLLVTYTCILIKTLRLLNLVTEVCLDGFPTKSPKTFYSINFEEFCF